MVYFYMKKGPMSSYSDKMSSRDLDFNNHDDNDEEPSQIRELFKFIKEYLEVEEKYEEVQKFVFIHPIASVFVIVTMAMFAVPLVVFGMFVIGSILMAFMGFLFVEGTALAIGTLILGGVLFFVGLFAMGFSMFLIFSYYVVTMSGSFMENIKDKLPAIPFFGNDSDSGPE